MDKYELVLKVEEIRRLANQKQYKKAMKILETIDVNKRRIITELSIYADVYAHNGKLVEAKDILLRIYDKSNTKGIIYKIIDLSIKLSEIEDAEDFFLEYLEISNNDPSQYILRYRIDNLRGVDINKQIETLIKYKEYEYEEKWALELAKLYHKAGEKEKCIKECEQIMLWFGEGVYVEQAKALKSYYTGEKIEDNQSFDNKKSGLDSSDIYTAFTKSNEMKDNLNANNEDTKEATKASTNEVAIEETDTLPTEMEKTIVNIEHIEDQQITEVDSYDDQEDMQILLNSLQDIQVNEEYNIDENLISNEELVYSEEQKYSDNIELREEQKISENSNYSIEQESNEEIIENDNSVDKQKKDVFYKEEIINLNEENKKEKNKKEKDKKDNHEVANNQFFGAGLFIKNLVGLKKAKEKKVSIEDKIQDMFHAASQLSNSYDNQNIKDIEEHSNNDVNLDNLDKILEFDHQENNSDISEKENINQKEEEQEQQEQQEQQEEEQEEQQEKQDHSDLPEEEEIYTSVEDSVLDDISSEDLGGNQETEENSVNILLTDMDKEPNILPDDDIIINNIKLNQIFYSFIKIPSVKERLCRYIIEIASSKASINFVITGTKSSGKTELGKMISKALYKLKVIKTPRIAKITAVKLNKIDLFSQKENLIDGCVIIEKASELNREMIHQIIEMIKEYESRISVILEDTKENLDNLFNEYQELNEVFKNKIDLPMYKGEDLIEFAKNYLMKLEYEIDHEASDILVSIADNIDKECSEEGRLIAILECIDYAKEKCDIRNRNYLMKMVSSGKYNETDLCMLRAIDFTE